ncbi:hypothetical protein [Streptomyces flavidovirens]|uniref:hypothetical protein n=1 Tax=Streptomyces flavidovirens TaxID=67298 RepID=UPI0003F91460|nr:hypothetical protein [Streptomyces flavidovirens]
MDHPPQRQAGIVLKALDPLPYPQRMRQLALWARRLADDGSLRAVLEELDGRGPYERGVAAVAAAVGRDADWVAARLADPDSFVRGQALRAAGKLGVPDSAYEAALDDAPAAVRHQLMRAIVRDGRTALADRMVGVVRDTWGDAEAVRLLPICGHATVARLLPALFHAVHSWKALGARHPGPVLDAVEGELSALPASLRDGWWQRNAHAVASALDAEPLRVLRLLGRYAPTALPLALRGRFGALAAADPAGAVRLLLGPGEYAIRRSGALRRSVLCRLARNAPREAVVELGRAMGQYTGDVARLAMALPPAERGPFWASVAQGQGEGRFGTVDAVLLDSLPRGYAARQARRMVDRARERGERWDTVLLAESYLPVAEARHRLVEATRRPTAGERAQAWPLLIRNAGRSGDPAAVTAVLVEMARLRNEQEPVRAPAVSALAATPAALFTDDAAPHLERVATDAVEARDSSPGVRQDLSRLALAVLREHAASGRGALTQWALDTLARLVGSTGGADLGRLDHVLPRGQEHQVFEALRPWLDAGAKKADYRLAFALTRALGKRAAAMPELQELLGRAVRSDDNRTARTAIALWLDPPAGRDERVERLLRHEPSAAVLDPVLRVLTARRTDLLDQVLGDTPPYGRFLAKDSPWTVPVGPDVRRWVPRQQRAVAAQLERVAWDEELPLYARAAAVARSAHLPGAGLDAVRRWTRAGDVVLAEAALAALAWTDRPAGALAELLSHAGGDRARVAVYAATRASRYVRPSRLGALLRGLVTPGEGAAKITSRKEAVRLAATRLPQAGAAGLLADAYAMPGQHRDVRATCVAFAAPLLGDDRVLRMLQDAAAGETAVRTAVLRVQPMDLPEPHRPRYARLVQEVCATEDDELAGLALRALAGWVPWAPGATAVLVAAISDPGRGSLWRGAASGLTSAAGTGPEAGLAVRRALEALVTADAEAEGTADDAGTVRDRPARRRAEFLVTGLITETWQRPDAVRPVAHAAAELLAGHRGFVPQAAGLLVHALDLDAGPAELRAALVRLAGLHDGRPALAVRTAESLEDRLDSAARPGNTDALLAQAGLLCEDGSHAGGLLAVTLTEVGGRRTDWSGPWRERLKQLRRHPVQDVSDAACAVVTAYE